MPTHRLVFPTGVGLEARLGGLTHAFGFKSRKRHRETGAHASLRAEGDAPADLLDQTLADGQTEPGPPLLSFASAAGFRADQRFKNPVAQVRTNPRAGIDDAELNALAN
mgnify:CR=1 FL=1